MGLDWNPVTNRISLLSIDDSGTYIVWSVTPDGKDVRRLYSDRAADWRDVFVAIGRCAVPVPGAKRHAGTCEAAALRTQQDAEPDGPHKRPSDGVPLQLQCLRRR